ncbi:hypothetical protein AK812_SmicGene25123 [Symbiodinium microadriaticum]|uniref:Uncharacterized protein n=1 Tax=Symbiodinium microadriaticum TaxID=2951 RepID=A0A1Q9DCZ4_SYMMI|nr:hypothetical protein AK812_SmicGene25123 [Symbiodinium microadriaticum]
MAWTALKEPVGKHAHMAKFKNVLDTQMKEFRQMQDDEERARQQERQDMLNQVKENQRLAAAEKAHHDAVRDKAKSINEQPTWSLESLRKRRKADEDRRQREQDCMLKWLHNENERLRQQRIADAEEYVEHDRMKIRNCQTIGADIAGRDARLEAELQAKIKKIQDDADQAAKEVKDMLDTLNLQMKQRDDEAQREKEDGIKQVSAHTVFAIFRLAADRAKEEKARLAMDAQLVEKMRSAWLKRLES